MHATHELKDRLCEELDNIAKSGKLDIPTLEKVDKIAGAAYHLDKLIKASEEEDYSSRGYSRDGGSYRMPYGGSYADDWREPPDGYSRRRDSMGRYARDGGSYREGYSRAEDRDAVMEKLERMAGTGTDQERETARRLLAEIKR